jgi:DNA uptake protein ComE-like DNA-binding protein
VTIESDGERWRVVSRDITARGPPSRKARRKAKHEAKPKSSRGPINIDTATQAELETLPGVGPVIARRIVEGRPYRSVDDFGRVKGLGKKRMEEIRLLVTAE